MNKEQIQKLIDERIYTNDQGEVTAIDVNDTLTEIVEASQFEKDLMLKTKAKTIVGAINEVNTNKLDKVDAVGERTPDDGEIFNLYWDDEVEGNIKQANSAGLYAHAEGVGTTAAAVGSHAEGDSTSALEEYTHAEGSGTTAAKRYSHAEGEDTIAGGPSSHAEGSDTQANGYASHAEGIQTIATKDFAHAEGSVTRAQGGISHAEGYKTQSIGRASHAEGIQTIATGENSHAEGLAKIDHVPNFTNSLKPDKVKSVSGNTFIPEEHRIWANYFYRRGRTFQIADKIYKIVDMNSDTNTITVDKPCEFKTGDDIYFIYGVAAGDSSHTEGEQNDASGKASHSEGYFNFAKGDYSHAEGYVTSTTNQAEHAEGKYNVSNVGTISSIGIGGQGQGGPKNAVEVMDDGRVFIIGIGGYDGTNPEESVDVKSVIDSNPSTYYNMCKIRKDHSLIYVDAPSAFKDLGVYLDGQGAYPGTIITFRQQNYDLPRVMVYRGFGIFEDEKNWKEL